MQQYSQFHSCNMRKGRHSEIGQYYFLTAVTHTRRPVFYNFRAARICIGSMRIQHEKGLVNSLAFVIMPEHFHWLVELRQGKLSDLMKKVKGETARRLNIHFEKSGRFWQPGYHDHALRTDEDLRQTARYLVNNPLRAGLVENLQSYPHWDAIWLE